jgi:primase-polymerase (primpol)-like protein
MAAHRQIPPAEMRSLPRWVRWERRYVASKPKTGRPLTTDYESASSTDASTWTTFAAVHASSVGAGVGFVLNGDGIVCIDLDGCIDANGELAAWAVPIVRAAKHTYTEVSPSGTGLHIWGRGVVEGGRVIRDHRSIEIYGDGRYVTVTGDRWPRRPQRLGDLSEVLATLD